MNVTRATQELQLAAPRPSGRPPGGGAMKAGMDAAAETLGLSKVDLKSALESGATLEDLAGAAGIGSGELKASMVEAISAAAPAEVAERVTANLDSVIAGRRPPPPPRAPKTDVGSAVAALAEALETSTEELLASIESGSLTELFENAGVEAEPGVLIDVQV